RARPDRSPAGDAARRRRLGDGRGRRGPGTSRRQRGACVVLATERLRACERRGPVAGAGRDRGGPLPRRRAAAERGAAGAAFHLWLAAAAEHHALVRPARRRERRRAQRRVPAEPALARLSLSAARAIEGASRRMSDAAERASARARFVVGPRNAGLRVDQALPAMSPLSRRRARALLATGAVERNGEPLRVQGRLLALGDVLDLAVDGAEGEALRAASAVGAPPPFVSLHDDGWLLAVNKPAGVLSQPAERREEGELAMDERVLLRRAFDLGRPPFLRLVHRLDRVTSGVLLLAAREAALAP